ncbi:hypothetical protein [Phenylobacterium sp.]|uniref:hypothetical protein n=1 Tax=Phenylobacterium sp. TaxID=1871053 RepID=UPI002734E083|nr:hypothetical protein [Phenylobacterium sp.]MDP3853145.1 hypothetical protein [Phenylobacterium sp.]
MADPIPGGEVPWVRALAAVSPPEDITEVLARADEKPENRIYRTADGHHVKIKTWQVEAVQAGVDNYFMSGSLCDETGTALVGDDGLPLIVGNGQGIGITELWRSNPKTKAEQVEEARRDYVLLLERVAKSRVAAPPAGVAKSDMDAIRAQLAATLSAPEPEVTAEVAATRAKPVPMPVLMDLEEARTALRSLDRTEGFGGLAGDLAALLMKAAASFSPVDGISQTAEIIYARRDEVTSELLALGAGLAALAATHGYQGLGLAGRGAGISAALRREAGEPHPIEGMAWPEPTADPVPLPELARPKTP